MLKVGLGVIALIFVIICVITGCSQSSPTQPATIAPPITSTSPVTTNPFVTINSPATSSVPSTTTLLLTTITPPPVTATVTATAALNRGYLYLEHNLNSSLNLIRESPDTGSPQDKTYWLATDNLLASYALKTYNPELSESLTTSLENYGYQNDHYIEVLFGNRTIEPTHAVDPNPKIIEDNKDYIIQTETGTNTIMPDFDQYFDKLCYEILWKAYGGNLTEANNLYNEAITMWDGKGFEDKPFIEYPQQGYATYKLAIFYYTARVLGKLDALTFKDTLISTINGLQASNGGFHTSYHFDNNGALQSQSSTNTETTSLILIALNYKPKPLP